MNAQEIEQPKRDSSLSRDEPEVVRRARFAGWYLAKNGYDAQQTDEPVEPDRRDNLWEPLPGDHGAHGSFGERAIVASSQLWISKNRNLLAIAGAGLAGFALSTLLKRSRDPRS